MHSVTFLIGISGSGKTYWQQRFFKANPEHIVFTRGQCEKAFYYSKRGRFADIKTVAEFARRHTSFPAFMWRRFEATLCKHQQIILDGEFLTVEQRKPYLARIRERGIPVYALIFDTPFEIAYQRNLLRKAPMRKTKAAIEKQSKILNVQTLPSEVDAVQYVSELLTHNKRHR